MDEKNVLLTGKRRVPVWDHKKLRHGRRIPTGKHNKKKAFLPPMLFCHRFCVRATIMLLMQQIQTQLQQQQKACKSVPPGTTSSKPFATGANAIFWKGL